MQKSWLPIISAVLVVFLFRCGGSPVQQSLLHGYENNTMRMKYSSKLFDTKLESGAPGYRLETEIDYGVGNIDRRSTQRIAWMHDNFSMARVQVTRNNNEIITTSTMWVEANQVVVRREQTDQAPFEKKVDVEGRFYSDLHPLLYSGDLTEPGSEKHYRVFYEQELTIKPVTVRFVGQTVLREDGQTIDCLHYQIQNVGASDKFDDYYLDPESKRIVKISTGFVIFKLPG